MTLAFARNSRVFVREQGLGKIVGFGALTEAGEPRPALKGEAPEFYVVQLQSGRMLVRVATADELIRALITKTQAAEVLRILRQKVIKRGSGALIARSRRITATGSAADHATFLRELYERSSLSREQMMAICLYEDLVLDELAEVTKRRRGAIQAELRRRYPAMQQHIEANRLAVTLRQEAPRGLKASRTR